MYGTVGPWCRAATCLRLDVGLLEEEGQEKLLLGGHVSAEASSAK